MRAAADLHVSDVVGHFVMKKLTNLCCLCEEERQDLPSVGTKIVLFYRSTCRKRGDEDSMFANLEGLEKTQLI